MGSADCSIMASLKYYGLGPRGAKALIAANFAGVSLESVPVEMGVTNKTPEYLAMCPTGKVRTDAVSGKFKSSG